MKSHEKIAREHTGLKTTFRGLLTDSVATAIDTRQKICATSKQGRKTSSISQYRSNSTDIQAACTLHFYFSVSKYLFSSTFDLLSKNHILTADADAN